MVILYADDFIFCFNRLAATEDSQNLTPEIIGGRMAQWGPI